MKLIYIEEYTLLSTKLRLYKTNLLWTLTNLRGFQKVMSLNDITFNIFMKKKHTFKITRLRLFFFNYFQEKN